MGQERERKNQKRVVRQQEVGSNTYSIKIVYVTFVRPKFQFQIYGRALPFLFLFLFPGNGRGPHPARWSSPSGARPERSCLVWSGLVFLEVATKHEVWNLRHSACLLLNTCSINSPLTEYFVSSFFFSLVPISFHLISVSLHSVACVGIKSCRSARSRTSFT